MTAHVAIAAARITPYTGRMRLRCDDCPTAPRNLARRKVTFVSPLTGRHDHERTRYVCRIHAARYHVPPEAA